MRKDMKKIIHDGPSMSKSGKKEPQGAKKTRAKLDIDHATSESMSKKWGTRHRSNLKYEPIYRFLNSKVGHLWDKVHSELAQNGVLEELRKHGIHINELVDIDSPKDYFKYKVENGILRKTNKTKFKFKRKHTEDNDFVNNNGKFYQKIDGIWYQLKMKSFLSLTKTFSDITFPLQVFEYNAEQHWNPKFYNVPTKKLYQKYKDNVYAYGKRQINSKELKELNLQND